MADDLKNLSDDELLNLIHDLQIETDTLLPFIDDDRIWNQRTVKLIRGTILTAGGFFGAAFDALSLLLVLVGFIDWLEAITDDARAFNRHLSLQQRMVALRDRINAAAAELARRRRASNP